MVDFKITTETVEEGIVAISVKGFLDHTAADELQTAFKGLFSQSIYRFIVDLSELTHLGSAGIGVFISILDILNHNKGTLVFVQSDTSKVQQSLKMFEMSTIYPVVDDRATALSRIKMFDSIR
ncbi:unnamed protein product [marine sediment metagenome]|uniref:STAS domain-containing protein n=1 Tax=marine sediment metagenome TaxID=412755 RepID=X1MFF8_9ZZZZ